LKGSDWAGKKGAKSNQESPEIKQLQPAEMEKDQPSTEKKKNTLPKRKSLPDLETKQNERKRKEPQRRLVQGEKKET